MHGMARLLGLLLLACLASPTVRGDFNCACTTADCIASGIDICRAELFCYSKLKRLPEDAVVLLEKGCLGRRRSELCAAAVAAAAADSVVHIEGQLFVHCCSLPWCNSLLPASPPAPLTTAAPERPAPWRRFSTHRPPPPALRARQATPAAASATSQPLEPWRLPSAPAAAETDAAAPPLPPLAPPSSVEEAASAPEAGTGIADPLELPSGFGYDGLGGGVNRRRRPKSGGAMGGGGVGGTGSVGGSGQVDLVHPVFIAVPVTSLCLILSALAALIVLVRRRDQLHYQPGEQQYHLYFRNSMLTADCEAADNVAVTHGPAVPCGGGDSPAGKSGGHPSLLGAGQTALLSADYPDVTRHTEGVRSSPPL